MFVKTFNTVNVWIRVFKSFSGFPVSLIYILNPEFPPTHTQLTKAAGYFCLLLFNYGSKLDTMSSQFELGHCWITFRISFAWSLQWVGGSPKKDYFLPNLICPVCLGLIMYQDLKHCHSETCTIFSVQLLLWASRYPRYPKMVCWWCCSWSFFDIIETSFLNLMLFPVELVFSALVSLASRDIKTHRCRFYSTHKEFHGCNFQLSD